MALFRRRRKDSGISPGVIAALLDPPALAIDGDELPPPVDPPSFVEQLEYLAEHQGDA